MKTSSWCPSSGRARLYTWSVIHQNAAPFAARTPYVVAMVDLAEGPRLMTVVEDCRVDDLRADMELALAFRDDEDGFVVPVFRPVPSEHDVSRQRRVGEQSRGRP